MTDLVEVGFRVPHEMYDWLHKKCNSREMSPYLRNIIEKEMQKESETLEKDLQSKQIELDELKAKLEEQKKVSMEVIETPNPQLDEYIRKYLRDVGENWLRVAPVRLRVVNEKFNLHLTMREFVAKVEKIKQEQSIANDNSSIVNDNNSKGSG